MPRDVRVYDAIFDRVGEAESVTLTVQGDTRCQAKNMAFTLIEFYKHQQGISGSLWRLRSLTLK
jgi:hypothetical protein